MSALERIRAVLAAGARIADPGDPLGREARKRVVATSGLSREGVELVLREHLETRATEAELERFVACAGRASRCAVVLSANVCTAALRAIAFGVATAPDVLVRASRRDPVVAELVVRALRESGSEGRVELVAELPTEGYDELHVYGADETIDALRAEMPAGVVVRGHGTGFGVALIPGGADASNAARRLASDVVPFDQRGCLSPRFAFVEGEATAFARALAAALEDAASVVPRGALDDATREAIARHAAAMQAVGTVVTSADALVTVDPTPRALALPPAARVVHVVAASPAQAATLLAPWSRYLTAIGVASPAPLPAEVAALAPGARVVALGTMQRPAFDGPVDLRRTPD